MSKHFAFLTLFLGVAIVLLVASYFACRKPVDLPPTTLASAQKVFAPSAYIPPLHRHPKPMRAESNVVSRAVERDLAFENTELPALLVAKILEENPSLQVFNRLNQMVLKSGSDESKYQALLSDVALVDEAFKKLRDVSQLEYSLKDSLERIYYLKFLEEAARWEGNPQRVDLFSKMARFLNSFLHTKEMAVDAKKSFTQDRVEVFQILERYAPEIALDFVEQHRSGPMARFLAWAVSGKYIRKEGA